MRDEVAPLLNRFLDEMREAVPLEALWAHGSLALGDFRPGRSDLDMIAVIASPAGSAERHRLQAIHHALEADDPQAAKLHCSYMVRGALTDTSTRHLTWAHRELTTRAVTPVSRRELRTGDLSLFGPPPSALLPDVGDAELAEFVRHDLRTFWLPATLRPTIWLRDVWVDLGALTTARASVTLADGRLISKGEALDVLPTLGAPQELVDEIRARRYASPETLNAPQRVRRARQTRAFTRSAIQRVLAS
ncbi:nucleotidyltransferase domain-containing protein [Actinacidiphila acidipaludis]|uniref:Nucleotidyltransferase domain-containing protein n=1 Tax=Actinacidiphila acidipaludis TaxID=2873382 RepID=A0ABS7QBI7_9ACTN|nr:nucleotidyltransferase domain-containing protein [Streptomyces acidipaludis]MBY8879149.1 nucleotidyltransferase domain-containing protein [Streptomyces acidipaludis]